jgi:hypothetical protein
MYNANLKQYQPGFDAGACKLQQVTEKGLSDHNYLVHRS